MPPVPANVSDCVHALLEQLMSHQTTSPCSVNDTSAPKAILSLRSESQALLYIVVTLLFYSGGIIVGIITYLKRERQEIEEDKAFDEYINSYIEPETRKTFHKVQQVIARLKYLQEEKQKKMTSKGNNVKSVSIDNDDKKDTNDESECVDNSVVKISNSLKDSDNMKIEDNLMCDDDEPLSSIVAKLIDPEKHPSLDEQDFDDGDEEEEDIHGCGMTKTQSMQSIKDYTEEPGGRSARSSMIGDDDNEIDDESSTLIHPKADLSKENVSQCKTINKGCIVTNV